MASRGRAAGVALDLDGVEQDIRHIAQRHDVKDWFARWTRRIWVA